MGVLAVDMETASLYIAAAKAGKRSAAIFTISDLMFTGDACTAEERQNSFDDMIRLALTTAKETAER